MCWRGRTRSSNDFRFSIGGQNTMTKIFRTRILRFRSDNLKSKIQNLKWVGIFGILVLILGCVGMAQAQQPKIYRVGVLLPGEAWYEIVDGLRVGLRQLGLEER